MQLGSKKAATDAVEAVVDTITRAVASGEQVAITGFGVFEKVARPARTGRNPRTGAAVKIKKTTVPKFKAGPGLQGRRQRRQEAAEGRGLRRQGGHGHDAGEEDDGQEDGREEDDADQEGGRRRPQRRPPAKKAPAEEGSRQEGGGEEDDGAQALVSSTAHGPGDPTRVPGPVRVPGALQHYRRARSARRPRMAGVSSPCEAQEPRKVPHLPAIRGRLPRERSAAVGHGEDRQVGDPAGPSDLDAHPLAQPQVAGPRRRRRPGRRSGSSVAVVEQHRAGPRGRVEAADRCLHSGDPIPAYLSASGDRPACRPVPRRCRGGCSGRPASSPAVHGPRPRAAAASRSAAVSTSRASDGQRGRVDLVGAGAGVPGGRAGAEHRPQVAGRPGQQQRRAGALGVPDEAAPVPRRRAQGRRELGRAQRGQVRGQRADGGSGMSPARERGAVGERRVQARVRCVAGHLARRPPPAPRPPRARRSPPGRPPRADRPARPRWCPARRRAPAGPGHRRTAVRGGSWHRRAA